MIGGRTKSGRGVSQKRWGVEKHGRGLKIHGKGLKKHGLVVEKRWHRGRKRRGGQINKGGLKIGFPREIMFYGSKSKSTFDFLRFSVDTSIFCAISYVLLLEDVIGIKRSVFL